MLGNCLDRVRKSTPLVHNITNYVTVNDVANILLACGGSPIMSDEPEDVEDITSICGGLNINIGTLNQRSIEGMHRAGRKAADLGHTILLDPVGAGASALRTRTAVELMHEIPFTVIRGNISEIKTLALGSGTTKGVDADVADAVTEANLGRSCCFCEGLCGKKSCHCGNHRRDRSGQRRHAVLYHPQRPPGNGKGHRHRLPAFRHDDRFRDGKPGKPAGSRSSRRVRHGAGRGDRLEPHGGGGREFHLPQSDHRRHLQYGWRNAEWRSQV